jgi:hypothetical protein
LFDATKRRYLGRYQAGIDADHPIF